MSKHAEIFFTGYIIVDLTPEQEEALEKAIDSEQEYEILSPEVFKVTSRANIEIDNIDSWEIYE